MIRCVRALGKEKTKGCGALLSIRCLNAGHRRNLSGGHAFTRPVAGMPAVLVAAA
jgi:hypothetical protein